jgi:hypothetical protein
MSPERRSLSGPSVSLVLELLDLRRERRFEIAKETTSALSCATCFVARAPATESATGVLEYTSHGSANSHRVAWVASKGSRSWLCERAICLGE